MANNFFSIIIPTLNEEKNISVLLESLAGQTDHNFEVTVADSLSKDRTLTEAEKFKARLTRLKIISRKCKNVSSARNLGAKNSSGDFLVFFDADVELERDFIKGIKNHILEKNLDFLTVWNRPKNDAKLTGKIVLAFANFLMTVTQKIKPAANGPCIIIKRRLFQKINGFNEEIVFGEDFDLCQKANRLKAKFAVFPQPKLYLSTRRFEKEGLILSLYKSIKAIIYQLFFGPIKKPIFKYEMGGQYYEK